MGRSGVQATQTMFGESILDFSSTNVTPEQQLFYYSAGAANGHSFLDPGLCRPQEHGSANGQLFLDPSLCHLQEHGSASVLSFIDAGLCRPQSQRLLLPNTTLASTPMGQSLFHEVDYFEQFLGATMAPPYVEPKCPSTDSLPMATMEPRRELAPKAHPGAKVPIISLSFGPVPVQAQQPGKGVTYAGKRGKSVSDDLGVIGGKQLKPLLDIDTKRAHHIASEHKRRGRIRNELQRIAELIPELAEASKPSQSTILSTAADFIQAILEENRMLRSELERPDSERRSHRL